MKYPLFLKTNYYKKKTCHKKIKIYKSILNSFLPIIIRKRKCDSRQCLLSLDVFIFFAILLANLLCFDEHYLFIQLLNTQRRAIVL